MNIRLFKYTALTLIVFLFSCSVQKRYHRKGLTVNWKKISLFSKKEKNNDLISINKNIVHDKEELQIKKNLKEELTYGNINKGTDLASIENDSPIDAFIGSSANYTNIAQKENALKKEINLFEENKFTSTDDNKILRKPPKKSLDPENDEDSYELDALVGFVLSTIAVVTYVPVLYIFFWTSLIPIIALFVMALIGTSLSIFGLVDIRKSKGKKKGKVLAIIGLFGLPLLILISAFILGR